MATFWNHSITGWRGVTGLGLGFVVLAAIILVAMRKAGNAGNAA